MAYDYNGKDWESITYNSMGGGRKIKVSAARNGATIEVIYDGTDYVVIRESGTIAVQP